MVTRIPAKALDAGGADLLAEQHEKEKSKKNELEKRKRRRTAD